MSTEIQARLRTVRTTLNLTQKALASKLGVPYSTLVKWEQDVNTPRGLSLTALEERLAALLKQE